MAYDLLECEQFLRVDSLYFGHFSLSEARQELSS